MNLVAKEYVACRYDDDGALVLSEFAGAADELRQAWLVNPYDINGMKAALLEAYRADRPGDRAPDAGDAQDDHPARRGRLGDAASSRASPTPAPPTASRSARPARERPTRRISTVLHGGANPVPQGPRETTLGRVVRGPRRAAGGPTPQTACARARRGG